MKNEKLKTKNVILILGHNVHPSRAVFSNWEWNNPCVLQRIEESSFNLQAD